MSKRNETESKRLEVKKKFLSAVVEKRMVVTVSHPQTTTVATISMLMKHFEVHELTSESRKQRLLP